MPVITYDRLIQKIEQNDSFIDNAQEVSKFAELLDMASTAFAGQPIADKLKQYSNAFKDLLLNPYSDEANVEKIKNALETIQDFGDFLRDKNGTEKSNYELITETLNKSEAFYKKWFDENLEVIDNVAELDASLGILFEDTYEEPAPEDAYHEEEYPHTEFGLPDPKEHSDSVLIGHFAGAYLSKDPASHAQFEALEKAAANLDNVGGLAALLLKNKVNSIIEASKDLAHNIGDNKTRRRLAEAKNSIRDLRDSLDELAVRYPEDFKKCCEACKDLSDVFKASEFNLARPFIEKSNAYIDPWEEYRTDLMWKWEPSSMEKREISEAIVATMNMNKNVPFDENKLKKNAEKIRSIPGFNELPSDVIKDYMKEDMLLNFAYNINHPFAAENIYKPHVDVRNVAFNEINYMRKNILDRSVFRSKEWKSFVSNVDGIVQKGSNPEQFDKIFRSAEKYFEGDGGKKALRTKTSELNRTEQVLDVLAALSRTNPFAKAKVQHFMNKINTKRKENNMEPFSLEGRTVKTAEAHANKKIEKQNTANKSNSGPVKI